MVRQVLLDLIEERPIDRSREWLLHAVDSQASYVLLEMVANSLGELPTQAYFPAGLRKLLEHDAHSEISYIETLKTFLDENMNYTSAAKLLYIHRSTLVDRVSRIQGEMDVDLNDPNERLHLQLLLKAMELEELIRHRQ